jgi:hypothetical protein
MDAHPWMIYIPVVFCSYRCWWVSAPRCICMLWNLRKFARIISLPMSSGNIWGSQNERRVHYYKEFLSRWWQLTMYNIYNLLRVIYSLRSKMYVVLVFLDT